MKKLIAPSLLALGAACCLVALGSNLAGCAAAKSEYVRVRPEVKFKLGETWVVRPELFQKRSEQGLGKPVYRVSLSGQIESAGILTPND